MQEVGAPNNYLTGVGFLTGRSRSFAFSGTFSFDYQIGPDLTEIVPLGPPSSVPSWTKHTIAARKDGYVFFGFDRTADQYSASFPGGFTPGPFGGGDPITVAARTMVVLSVGHFYDSATDTIRTFVAVDLSTINITGITLSGGPWDTDSLGNPITRLIVNSVSGATPVADSFTVSGDFSFTTATSDEYILPGNQAEVSDQLDVSPLAPIDMTGPEPVARRDTARYATRTHPGTSTTVTIHVSAGGASGTITGTCTAALNGALVGGSASATAQRVDNPPFINSSNLPQFDYPLYSWGPAVTATCTTSSTISTGGQTWGPYAQGVIGAHSSADANSCTATSFLYQDWVNGSYHNYEDTFIGARFFSHFPLPQRLVCNIAAYEGNTIWSKPILIDSVGQTPVPFPNHGFLPDFQITTPSASVVFDGMRTRYGRYVADSNTATNTLYVRGRVGGNYERDVVPIETGAHEMPRGGAPRFRVNPDWARAHPEIIGNTDRLSFLTLLRRYDARTIGQDAYATLASAADGLYASPHFSGWSGLPGLTISGGFVHFVTPAGVPATAGVEANQNFLPNQRLDYRYVSVRIRSIGAANLPFKFGVSYDNVGDDGLITAQPSSAPTTYDSPTWNSTTGADGVWVERMFDLFSSNLSLALAAAYRNGFPGRLGVIYTVTGLQSSSTYEIEWIRGVRQNRSLVSSLAGSFQGVTDGLPYLLHSDTDLYPSGGTPNRTGWHTTDLRPPIAGKVATLNADAAMPTLQYENESYIFDSALGDVYIDGTKASILDAHAGDTADLTIPLQYAVELASIPPVSGDVISGAGGAWGFTTTLEMVWTAQIAQGIATCVGPGVPEPAGIQVVAERISDSAPGGAGTPDATDGYAALGAPFLPTGGGVPYPGVPGPYVRMHLSNVTPSAHPEKVATWFAINGGDGIGPRYFCVFHVTPDSGVSCPAILCSEDGRVWHTFLLSGNVQAWRSRIGVPEVGPTDAWDIRIPATVDGGWTEQDIARDPSGRLIIAAIKQRP